MATIGRRSGHGRPEDGAAVGISRRRLFVLTAAAAGAATLRHVQGRLERAGFATGATVAVADFVTFVRPGDQALVTIRFVNLVVDPTGTMLVAVDPAAPCALVLDLGVQHAAEEGVDLDALEPVPTRTVTRRLRTAAASQVVVGVAGGLAYTADSLFDLAARPLVVDPRADLAAGAAAPDTTGVALPADVLLSPGSNGRAIADTATRAVAGVTTIWRLRLGTDDGGGGAAAASAGDPLVLRAIDGGHVPDAFSRSLDQNLRTELVTATTAVGDPGYPGNEPLLATKLALGLRGAAADLAGAWPPPGFLAAYSEQIRSGRTTSVTVVQRGYLAPFGIAASVVEVGERRFETATDGSVVSVLILSEALVVGDPVVGYPRPLMPDEGRRLPFTSVRIVPPTGAFGRAQVTWTDATGTARSIDPDRLWQLADAGGVPLVFDHVATDRGGNEVRFATGAYFVPADRAFTLAANSPLGQLVDLFSDAGGDAIARRTIGLGGQPLAFAAEAVSGSGATTKPTTELVLALDRPDPSVTRPQLEALSQPAFYAAMTGATVTDPALDALRSAAVPMAGVDVVLDPRWLAHGLGADNPGDTFLGLVDPVLLAFGGDGEGLVAPSLNVDVYGQDLGISIDIPALLGTWDPAAALGDATLLGIIPLRDILGPIVVDLTASLAVPGVPGLSVAFDPPAPAPPAALCASFSWAPALRSQSFLGHEVFVVTADFGAEGLVAPFTGATAARFVAETCVALDPGGADVGTDLVVSVERFALLLPPGAPALAVLVEGVTYHQPADAPAILDIDVAGYQFVGELAFLEPFRDLLATTGFTANVAFGPTGIDADLGVSVPDVFLGVVSLSAIHIGISIFVPFPEATDVPFTVGFSIGTAAAPVAVGVWFFKGTASFEVDLQPHPIGVARFAASLGMGAEIAAGGFGVSGSIGMEIAASIEYRRTPDGGGSITIGGSFKLHGEIDVFVIVRAGVEATLTLTYLVNRQVLQAKGEVVGWLTVCGIHKEWRLEAEESFDLGDGAAARLASHRATESNVIASAPAAPAVRDHAFSRRRVVGGPSAPTVNAAPRPAAGGPPPTAPGGTFGDVYSSPQWQSYCGAFI